MKKKQAKDKWIALHGDAEEDAMKINYVDEEMEDYDDEEDYTKEGEEGEGEEEENDEDDNDNDDDEVSEYISEAEEGEDKSDQELDQKFEELLNQQEQAVVRSFNSTLENDTVLQKALRKLLNSSQPSSPLNLKKILDSRSMSPIGDKKGIN